MPRKPANDLNNTEIEAPGGTQATHAATEGVETTGSPRARAADRVDRVSDELERRALELELKGGLKAKAAPAVRRAGRAIDLGAAYVRERDVNDMREDLERGIREHPLRSMVVALGAGYLLARLLD